MTAINRLPFFAKLGVVGLLVGFLQGMTWADPVATQPLPPPPAQEIVVEAAPPPPQTEVIIARPSPRHVWIGGYWAWHEGRHVWMAGHWDLPPREHAVWEAPRWEFRGGRYAFVPGRWRDNETRIEVAIPIGRGELVVGAGNGPGHPTEMIIREGPPAPRREVMRERERPSPRHMWIAGYWAWREGRHTWMAGHWELPPREHAVWEVPRWEHRNGGFVFIEGRWR